MSEQTSNHGVVPIYAARLHHLVHATFVSAKCDACGHAADIPVSLIMDRLPDFAFVQDIHRALRCQNCDVKGQATIDFRRALGYDKLDERMAARKK